MALADTANLVVQLRLDDKLSGGLGRVHSQLSALQAGAGQVGKGVGQIGAGLARIGTIAATGFAVGVGAAVKVAGDFEAQLNTINTIVKLNGAQLTTLGEGIRSTFRETGAPLEELTAAYYDLLSAGVKVGDAQAVLNTAVKLGIGGIATTKESVDLLTTAINAYGLNASQAAGAADIFAAAVRDGKVTVAELSGSFADVAPLASQVGIKLEEIGAGYATLTARGVEATEVGTQFNRAIIELLKPGPDLVAVMKGLGLETFETSLKQKGLVQTLEDVRIEAEKQGIPFQDLFGRLEAYKFALATTGPNQAKFNQELAAMGKAAGETNAQFEERQKGLNFQIAKLKAAAQDAGITIGQALIPKLVPLIERLSTFINANQGKIATFGQKLADGLSAFADKLGTTDFTGVIEGLKLLGEVGKKVVDIFLSLPPGVQGALIAGLAVNKLSGGLIGQGAGNIAGGLLKIAFARGSTPATPLFVTNVGGLPGAGGGAPVAAAGTSLIGTVAAVAAGVAVGTLIAAPAFEGSVAPARKFEQSQFNALTDRLSASNTSLKDIDQAIATLEAQEKKIGSNQIDFLAAGASELTGLVTGQKGVLSTLNDQLANLRAQRSELKEQLGKVAVYTNMTSTGIARFAEQDAPRQLEANRAAASMLDRLRAVASSSERTAAKNFSPSFSPTIVNNNTVNAQLSVAQALQTITISNSIRYDGKLLPI